MIEVFLFGMCVGVILALAVMLGAELLADKHARHEDWS